VDQPRSAADQRSVLAATIRHTANWRTSKADKFADDETARRRSLRAKSALRTLANFVEGLPDDDPELALHALSRVDELGGRLALTPDAFALLSRFGLGKGAWQAPTPTERQMRNVLRRVDGIEARERRERKERAEAGYGDD
jgi:hypothetical protein